MLFLNESRKYSVFLKSVLHFLAYFSPQNSDNRKAKYFYVLKKDYEDYPMQKLKGILIDYEVSVKKNELAATGIFGLLFSALLSGLGKSTLNWFQTATELYVLKLSPVKTIPKEYIMKANLLSGILVAILIIILALLVYLVIANISRKRRICLVLKEVIREKENE